MKMTSLFKVRADKNRRDSSQSAPRFPVRVQRGEVVLRERRVNPDRRHPGLQTQELQVSTEEFDQLFDAYQQVK